MPNPQRSGTEMKKFYLSYTILTSFLFIFLLPGVWIYTRLTGRFRRHFGDRLGFLPSEVAEKSSSGPRIWIHAVSLGEVKVAVSIVHALKAAAPDCSFVLSTFTESGRDSAEKSFGPEVPVIYAPIDFIGSVRKALSVVRPDIMVFLETEIWPVWLFQAHQMGVRVLLVNGRISARSVKRYRRMRFLFREVLQNFDAFSMITPADAGRIESMGADTEKIEVNGNAKYDRLASETTPEVEIEIREVFNVGEHDRVLIAGSTRNGEEAMILDAYERIRTRYPDLILVIAPRHIERVSHLQSVFEGRGLEYQLRTDFEPPERFRTRQIVLVDTLGELFKIYSMGTVVFVGGSLVPLGGQNPLEPAVWGKAVLYGPHMENFLDAKAILENAGAGFQIDDARGLAERVVRLLDHPGELSSLGERARQAVLKNTGAAQRHAAVIKRFL